ncbi:P-loop containing nucleoside triphosphate hydrolase protein, partial [Cantharellus anzutake]|uniref:P-loop containing nucleoside triphosphate hydrolase protein n=1 Tax=Cantharellus anzutake TaxID=1750568 RepID=UPI0019057BEC
RNLVATAATGTGKTYTFFLPALYEQSGVTFIIVPLKKLAHQHRESAVKLGLSAMTLEAETISKEVINEIAEIKYKYVILGPDLLTSELMRLLWRNTKFVSQINRIIVDETHCVTQWLSFRSKYQDLRSVYAHLRCRCQWYLTSATLDTHTCSKVLSTINMDPYHNKEGGTYTKWIRRSNDRPNLHYCVWPMEYSRQSCKDLAFLVPLGLKESDPILEPFFVYCNSRNDAERCATYLQSRVEGSLKRRIIWVHSGMSDKHKQKAVETFRNGELIGITATETLGLGFDLPNITRLVQFGPPDNLSTLAQRFGRAARDPDTTGIVILLAPRDYF